MRSTSWQGARRDDASLSEVLYVLRGRGLLVAGVVLVLALAALLLGLFREPVYTAEAIVSVTPQERLGSTEETLVFLEEVRGAVTTLPGFKREVMRRARWKADPDQFTQRLDPGTFANGDESGYRVRFSGSQPEQVARAANAYADLFVERVEQLNDERLAGGTLAADASVVQRAVPPQRPSPRPLLYAAVAAVVGILLGGAAALLLEDRSRGWRNVRDAELTLRAPVLGVIPDYDAAEREA